MTNLSNGAMLPMIIDDRDRHLFKVNRHAFVAPEILELEKQKVFDRCWLYVGHESELPEKGSFLTRQVGGRPVIISRDTEGTIRAFINSCPHRGNLVCRDKAGKSKMFTCYYHAWSFNLKGDVIGIPEEESYGPCFDKSKMGLMPVPRFDNYRGMLFLSYDPNIVSLEDYLGPAIPYIDFMLDYSLDGNEVVQGAQNYSMKANWKLLIENSIDGYHFASTHLRYVRQYLPSLGMDTTEYSPSAMRSSLMDIGIALGNGHSLVEMKQRALPIDRAKDELAEHRRRLIEKFGKERADQIADYNRNLFIFPNLILISMWRTVRTFYPVTPDYMEIDAWPLMPKGESSALRQARLENFISFLGPGGFGTPDDVAALEGCQKGFASSNELVWSDISRGMNKDQPGFTDEWQIRAFWRQWDALMRDWQGAVEHADHPAERVAAE